MTIRVNPNGIDYPELNRQRNVWACDKLLALLNEHHGNGEPAAVALASHEKPMAEPAIAEPELVAEVPPARSNAWFVIIEDKPAESISLADVREAVCKHFKIDHVELLKRRQLKAIVYRRSIAIYLARELTTKSWPQIGHMFGGLDHTSAIAAGRRVEAAIDAGDEATVADVSAIRAKLGRGM
jgi:hypothetical protein